METYPNEIYITRYDGQPLAEAEAEGLWRYDWREWLTRAGYFLVKATPIPVPLEGDQKGATIEVWQREQEEEEEKKAKAEEAGESAADSRSKAGNYVVYHSPLGKGPNSAGLYLGLVSEEEVAELLLGLNQNRP
jgi:hypothetical protein